MCPKQNLIVKCSAPGKIILHGEHSVVYGKLAIAASLDLRTTVTVEERSNNKFEINFVDLKFKRHFNLTDIKLVFEKWDFPLIEDAKEHINNIYLNPECLDHDAYIELIKTSLNISEENMEKNKFSSLISLLYLYFGIIYSAKIPVEALYISVKTELSLGSGTGSSASLMVSLSAAFLQYLITKKPGLKPQFEINDSYEHFNEFQLKFISKWGYQAEKIIHGNPSGIDNTVCTYGSLVSFRKGRAPFAVKCNREIRGLIVDTQVPKNTAIQVRKVSELRRKHPKITDAILEGMEGIADDALDLLIQLGDAVDVHTSDRKSETLHKDLAELTAMNHHLLQALGVSHPSLDETVRMMMKKGLKGKLTGAGGGGYAIALIPPYISVQDVNELCAELETRGFKGMITKLGSHGVKFEK